MLRMVHVVIFLCSIISTAQPMEKKYKKLTKEEIKLIDSKMSHAPMRLLVTTSKTDTKALKSISIDIDPKDPYVKILADRMLATVNDELNKGVGIAAPQVGINRNAIWVQRMDKVNQPFEFYLNPHITWYSSILRFGREGCLSIPDQFGKVYRSLAIQLIYEDLDGKRHEEIIEGFSAVIFQHEYDHLIGKLYTDRMVEQESQVFLKADQFNEVFYLKD